MVRSRTFHTRLLALAAVLALALFASSSIAEEASAPGSITFVGKNAIATANGTFHRWRVIEQKVDFADLAASYVVVEVDVASVDTQNAQRDDHLRTADFFEVERWPSATVRVHSARANGEAENGARRYAATFDLTIRDTTKSVEGEFRVLGEAPLEIEGELSIDRTQWGVGEPDSRFNPFAIRNDIPIRFRATLESR